MKKRRYFTLFISVIIVLIFSLGTTISDIPSSSQTVLSPSEIEKLNEYDRNLKDNELVLLIKGNGQLEKFMHRLDLKLEQKIENELGEKLEQILLWELDPEDNVMILEEKVQNYLDENYSEIIIGSEEFDLLVDRYLSNGGSGIAHRAKSDPTIGQIYLYLCIYNDYRETKADSQKPFYDQYYSKSIKEICREDIIRDFASTDILSILRTFVNEMNLNRSPPWPALNGYSIQTYARTWALSRNPYYLWFDVNNDCTNFASQSLFYGATANTAIGGFYEG